MTPASLLHFIAALLWCALLFVSIAGYGAVLLRLFGLRRPSVAPRITAKNDPAAKMIQPDPAVV